MRAARNMRTPPRTIALSTLAIVGKSIVMKKTMERMPVRTESPYITRWTLIGFFLTARQISQPTKPDDRIIDTGINIQVSKSPPCILKVFSQCAEGASQ